VTSATATSTPNEATAENGELLHATGQATAATSAPLARVRPRLRFGTEWALGRLTMDVTMLALGVAAAETGWRAAGFPASPLHWILAFPLLAVALLYVRGSYTARLAPQVLEEIRAVVGGTTVAAMAVVTARVVATDDVVPSTQAVRPWLFATACVVAGRAVLALADARARRRGEAARATLILGAGRVGQLVAQRLRERPQLGLRPVGFLDKEPLGELEGVPVLGASWDLERIVADHGVENVIVTFSTAPNDVLLRLARRCEELGVQVSFVPRLFEQMPERVGVEHLGGIPLLTPRRADPNGWQFALKYLGDRVAAAALVVLLAPVFVFTALLVLVTMGRPILFRQTRLGLDGREFEMLKFRTMASAPDEGGELDADWAAGELGGERVAPAMTGDRRTPLGRLLRLSSLDELPQLLNVLRGDMSLVGPRPERAYYARRFEERIYRYAERHRVKSGITGWAQVNGLRGKTSLADRVEWDNHYIENWSLWLDLKILLRTVTAALRQGS
jgi:exopolysaccharide biosynthesis polyprenyl glycosylphosphotransferase